MNGHDPSMSDSWCGLAGLGNRGGRGKKGMGSVACPSLGGTRRPHTCKRYKPTQPGEETCTRAAVAAHQDGRGAVNGETTFDRRYFVVIYKVCTSNFIKVLYMRSIAFSLNKNWFPTLSNIT